MPSMPDPRTGRAMLVFVSSRFTDLAAERAHLSHDVFPRLRTACEARGVVFGAVDLRWGVPTDRGTVEEVVQICFDEIDRCRPFFIGLLGGEPGWVPGALPQAVLQDNPWLTDAERQTITELEFRYAALHPDRGAPHAWFYLGAQPSNDPRLAALRDDLLARLPGRVRVGYASVEELGDRVYADFERLLKELYPAETPEDSLDRERELHLAYAATRAAFYVERGGELAALDAHARGGGPPLVVCGESGLGKSTLLAAWMNHRLAAGTQIPVIGHFVGATPASGSWSATVRHVIWELQRVAGQQEAIPDSDDDLPVALASWLDRATAGGRPVVLVIDAVNQLQGKEGVRELSWFPPELPPQVRLVVSTTQRPVVEALRRRGWTVRDVTPLSVEERAEVATAYLRWPGKGRRAGVVAPVAAADQAANPLFLVTLIDELCLLREDELDRRLRRYLEARTPGELFGQVLERQEADFGRDLVAGAMAALWAARRGLSELELVDLLGGDWTRWVRYRRSAGRMLVDLGGLVSFGHQHVRDAVQERYVPRDAQPAAHARLARYFLGGASAGHVEPTPRRADELPWQLLQAGDLESLHDYLKTPALLHATWKASRQDGMEYWAAVEKDGAHSKLEAYAEWIAHPEGRDPQVIDSIADLLHHTTKPRAAMPLRHYLVDHYRGQAQQERALAKALGNLAALYGEVDDPHLALPLLEEELELCRRLDDARELARTMYNLGYTHSMLSSLEEGERWVAESARLRRARGDFHGLAESLGFGAYSRIQQAKRRTAEGRHAEAMALLEEANRLLVEVEQHALGDRKLLGKLHGTRGLVLRELGAEPALIWQEYASQRSAAQGLGDTVGVAIALHNEATTRTALGDAAGAVTLLLEEERLSREIHDDEGELKAQVERGKALCRLGQRAPGLALIRHVAAAARAQGRAPLVEECELLLRELNA